MMSILILASISRCAISSLCPTDADLLAAVRSRDNALVQALSEQAYAQNPNDLVLFHTQRIRRIEDVICGDRLVDETTTITCKFTVRYWSQNAYLVAKLKQQDEGWEIVEELGVTRDRR